MFRGVDRHANISHARRSELSTIDDCLVADDDATLGEGIRCGLWRSLPTASRLACDVVTGGISNLVGSVESSVLAQEIPYLLDASAIKVVCQQGGLPPAPNCYAQPPVAAFTGCLEARAAIQHDLACRRYYQARRRSGDRHVGAQRNLFNKLVRKLYHCLPTQQRYDSATAFPHHQLPTAA